MSWSQSQSHCGRSPVAPAKTPRHEKEDEEVELLYEEVDDDEEGAAAPLDDLLTKSVYLLPPRTAIVAPKSLVLKLSNPREPPAPSARERWGVCHAYLLVVPSIDNISIRCRALAGRFLRFRFGFPILQTCFRRIVWRPRLSSRIHLYAYMLVCRNEERDTYTLPQTNMETHIVPLLELFGFPC